MIVTDALYVLVFLFGCWIGHHWTIRSLNSHSKCRRVHRACDPCPWAEPPEVMHLTIPGEGPFQTWFWVCQPSVSGNSSMVTADITKVTCRMCKRLASGGQIW